MKIHRSLAAFIIAFLGTLSILAQDVTVTVTPTQQVLPPQVLLYITDPGKFFTISLMNTSNETKHVHLGLQLEQTTPATGLAISTPTNRQPKVPFTIQANSVYTLTTVEMKKLFDHIPASEISCPEDLFGNYENGTFGLLPEGFYQVHITAYQWNENPLSTPVVESNPAGGVASFQVCYNAQAPQFLTPMLIGTADPEVGELDPLAAQFTWTEPLLACAPGFVNFKYSLRVVELLPNQQPDYAMDNNPTVYMAEGLPAPTCMIPVTAITQNFYAGKTYLAQVTATASTPSNSAMNYVLIENEGKSTFRKFCIKVNKNEDPEPEPEPEPKPEPEPDDDDDNKGKGGGGGDDKGGHKIYWGGVEVSDTILTDSLYTFRNPVITYPTFEELAARKILAGHDLAISWDRALHIGGEGLQPDTLQFEYKLKLYNGGTTADKEAALASDPVYEKTFATTDLMTDTIAWDSLKTFITLGDYLVLHIEPHCINSNEVGYSSDKNIVDFAIVEQLSKKYFECSSRVEITNKEPLKASADELKDKVIAIGEYQMTIDEISAEGEDGWQGKGRVEWNPMGTTVMVCVEFSGLKINTDYAVYEGKATTYSNNEMSDAEVVDKLFSDWGIDNLISDTGLPYADYLQSSATDGVKDIAKKLDLSKYYQYVKSGQAISSLLGVGDIDALYFPVALPDSINKSPVDLQIAGMTFSAEFATMNIIGEFTMPNSDYLKNDILVFGAPRLCISPDNIIPEGGTVALLSNFTILDPKSDFEFTFKAPTNVISPENGCYLAWKDYTFEQLGLDIEMKIPGLKKEVNGELTDSMPSIYAQTRISEWENWLIDRVSMDPFQAEELPGWTFTASDIVYDHSVRMNSSFMGKFPEGYDTEQSLTLGDVNSWQGLYIREISVKMPGALEFGDSTSTGDKRLKISAEDMFFDKSGATLRVGADDVLSAKTGKAGGWAFSLNSVSLEFIQDNFNHCKFDGTFDVPLIEGEIGYECQILHLGKDYKDKKEQYAYVFRTQQVDSLNFDFMLARADMDKNLTYFLVEATPNEKDSLETRVELLMGGTLTIGGTDYLQKKIDNLGMDFSIPGIHFAKMRIANCKQWESKFDFVKEMQNGKDNADILFSFYKNKDHEVTKNFWFSTGDWSLSSLPDKGDNSDEEAYMPSFDEDTYFAHGPSEYGPRAPADDDDKKNVASQKLGPFTFTLKDYSFDFKDSQLAVGLEGEVRFLEEIELGASAGITIKAELQGLTEAMSMDFSKLNFKYKETTFDKAAFDASFAGMTLKGSLAMSNSEDKKGFSGSIKFTMPGELFTVDALGGYYEQPDFNWGYFEIALGSSAGLRFDPVVINNIKGGFYFNCIRKSETEAEPQKGIIGVVAGIGLSTSVGEDALKGDMEMTVIYDRENDRLSTFVFTGTIEAVGGLVNSKASIVYECTDLDEYFSLNVTVDAKLDPMQSDMAKALKTEMDGITSKLQELNAKCEGLVADVKGSLTDLAGDSGEKASEGKREGSEVDVTAKTEEAQSKAESEYGMNVGSVEISLDLKITMKQEGKELNKVKWHLYIGQPDENLRCKFTYIDFKSPIVSVNIGANAYLCLGNELPNDGELPPIPAKVQEFLDGSTEGEGVKSDDMNKANRGRTKALENFYSSVNGGLMLGASAWGYVDVDLGLFYGEMGAIGGFDISLRKLEGTQCMNLGKTPGYHGWYGEGQLYAYLYAVFGLKLDLGFWEGKFEILNSGIGGVMRMGGINPNYFTGAARVKLTAFGGLVDVNRKFEFECGDVCDIFYGNALDDFQLFGNCSIGDTIQKNGWNEKHKINPSLSSKISIETLAPLNEHFRVLDPTELARIERDIDAEKAQLEALASRTFTFEMLQTYATLYEYDSPDDKSPITNYIIYDETRSFRTNHVLNLTYLQANKYYRLEVTGCAKELFEGVPGDPLKWNESKGDYDRVPWNQTINYYFCTGDAPALEEVPNLQEEVALAFPSDYGQIKGLEGVIDTAYVSDIANPVIALKRDLRVGTTTFTNGKLVWLLCNEKGDTIETRDNQYVSESGKYFYLKPTKSFTKVEKDKQYNLRLVYRKVTTHQRSEQTLNKDLEKAGISDSYEMKSTQNMTKEELLKAVEDAQKAQNSTTKVLTESIEGLSRDKGTQQSTGTSTTNTTIKRNRTNTPSTPDFEEYVDESLLDSLTVSCEAEDGCDELYAFDSCEEDHFITKLDYLEDADEENGYVGRMSMAPAPQIIKKRTTTTTTTQSTTTSTITTTKAITPPTTQSTTQSADTAKTTSSPVLSKGTSVASTDTAKSTSGTLGLTRQVNTTKGEIVLSDTSVTTPSTGTLISNVRNDASDIIAQAIEREMTATSTKEQSAIKRESSTTVLDGVTLSNQVQLDLTDFYEEAMNHGLNSNINAQGKQSANGSSSGTSDTSGSSGTSAGTVELISVEDTELLNLNLVAVDGNWRTGYSKNSTRYNVAYEVPFLGMRMREINFKYTEQVSDYTSDPTNASNLLNIAKLTDKNIAKTEGSRTSDGKLYRLCDPYWYMSYISNYAFIGGYAITDEKDKFNIQATTSQSLLITGLGGMYEGHVEKGESAFGIANGVDKIRRLSYYIPNSDYFPLPVMDYDLHTYRTGGDARCPAFRPSDKLRMNVYNYTLQMRDLPVFGERLSDEQYQEMGKHILNLVGHEEASGDNVKKIAEWYAARVGTYHTLSYGPVKLEFPLYQAILIWGSQFDDNSVWSSHNGITLWKMTEGFDKSDTRPHESMSEDIHNSLWGLDKKGTGREKVKFEWDIIKDATFEIYRVNAYNTYTKEYEYSTTFPLRYPGIPSTYTKFKLGNPLEYSGNESIIQQ